MHILFCATTLSNGHGTDSHSRSVHLGNFVLQSSRTSLHVIIRRVQASAVAEVNSKAIQKLPSAASNHHARFHRESETGPEVSDGYSFRISKTSYSGPLCMYHNPFSLWVLSVFRRR